MNTKITGFENRPVQVGAEKSVTKLREGAANPAEKASAGNPVRITDQARQLAGLEQAVQSMPIVDEVRVAAIREAIENGSYEASPERIADKLLQMDRQLNSMES